MPDEKRTEQITSNDGDTFDVTYTLTSDARAQQQYAERVPIVIPGRLDAPGAPGNHVQHIFARQLPDALHAYTERKTGEEWRTTIKLEYSFYTLAIGADLALDAASSLARGADIIEQRVKDNYPEAWDNNALPIEWGVVLRSNLYRAASADSLYSPPGQADPDPHQIAEPSWDEDTPSPWSIRYEQLDFLDYFTQPTVIATGEPLDWHTLDMVTPYQEVDKWLDYTPAPLQQYAPIQTLVRLLREEGQR